MSSTSGGSSIRVARNSLSIGSMILANSLSYSWLGMFFCLAKDFRFSVSLIISFNGIIRIAVHLLLMKTFDRCCASWVLVVLGAIFPYNQVNKSNGNIRALASAESDQWSRPGVPPQVGTAWHGFHLGSLLLELLILLKRL